jgi:hypothetical protein
MENKNHFLGKQPIQSYDEYKKLNEDKSFKEAFWAIGTFNEGMGVLVKEGYIDIRLVAQLMSGGIRGFWERMKPAVRARAPFVRALVYL